VQTPGPVGRRYGLSILAHIAYVTAETLNRNLILRLVCIVEPCILEETVTDNWQLIESVM